MVIPEIGSRTAATWSDGTGCWLQSLLPAIAHDAHVLEFLYAEKILADFSWQNLVSCGDSLLEDLLSVAASADVGTEYFQSHFLELIMHSSVAGLSSSSVMVLAA